MQRIVRQIKVKYNTMHLPAHGTWPWAAHNKLLNWFARPAHYWLRVELSSTLLKYRTALTWQLWKRRPNGVFVQATRS